MMKKIIACLVILAVVTTAVWSQEDAGRPANTVGLQLTVLGGALNYERSINPNLSIVGDVSINLLPLTLTAAAKARLYPFGGAFFAELGIGYGTTFGYFGSIVGMTTSVLTAGGFEMFGDGSMLNGVVLTPAIGWKIDLINGGSFRLPLLINLGVDVFMGVREDKTFNIPVDIVPNLRIGAGFSF